MHGPGFNGAVFYRRPRGDRTIPLRTLVRRRRADVTDSTGSSSSGPMTRTNAIRGLSGNTATAIASESGEFLAIAVNTSEVVSSKG